MSRLRAAALGASAISGVAGGEELLLLQLDGLPRRVADHGGEAAAPAVRLGCGRGGDLEDLGELEPPVEEPVLGGAVEDGPGGGLAEQGARVDPRQGARRDGDVVLGLGLDEGGAPGVGAELLAGEVGGGEVGGIPARGLVDVGEAGHCRGQRVGEAAAEVGVADGGLGDVEEALVALVAFELVVPLQAGDDALVVAGEGDEGVVGDACGDQGGGGAEQGVADLDVGVEEGQRPAGAHRLEPEADLGEFGGHGVEVDAVDAAGDDVVEGVLDVGRGWARRRRCGRWRGARRSGGRRRRGSGRSRRRGRRP